MSVFFGFNPSFLGLLLIVSFHLLLDVFFDCAFEEMSTEPNSKDVNTFLEVLNPIFFCFFAIYTPYSDRNLSSSFFHIVLDFFIRFIHFLFREIWRSVFCKEKTFLKRAQILFEQLKISYGHELIHKHLPDWSSSPLILFDCEVSGEGVFCLFDHREDVLEGDVSKLVLLQHESTAVFRLNLVCYDIIFHEALDVLKEMAFFKSFGA
jgi:hypothetical protein